MTAQVNAPSVSTLQANNSGAWKSVLDFDADRRDMVVAALHLLGEAAVRTPRWCLLHKDGSREWLG